jgi:predicted dehydrogenase
MRPVIFAVVGLFGLMASSIGAADKPEVKTLRAGIIGLDTSHVTAFTKVLNNPKNTGFMAKVKVVAAFPGGSPDIPSSADRVEGFTQKLKAMGVQIVDSIPDLLAKVDVVLLESVDGRPHLEQVIPVFKAGKPVFIDKPLSGSLADAIAIQMLGKKYKTPWFCSSSLRFSPGILSFRGEHEKIGKVYGVSAWGPCSLEKHHPDLYWYGIHGCETLYTIMGPGCRTVSRVQTESGELVAGVWADGRIGTFRGIRKPGKNGYGAFVFGTKGMMPSGTYAGYTPLVEKIAEFFHTKKPAVNNDETVEVYAFMEAADESKRQGGKPASIQDVMAKAEQQAKRRNKVLDP